MYNILINYIQKPIFGRTVRLPFYWGDQKILVQRKLRMRFLNAVPKYTYLLLIFIGS